MAVRRELGCIVGVSPSAAYSKLHEARTAESLIIGAEGGEAVYRSSGSLTLQKLRFPVLPWTQRTLPVMRGPVDALVWKSLGPFAGADNGNPFRDNVGQDLR